MERRRHRAQSGVPSPLGDGGPCRSIPIDVLVNNAGYGLFGAVEETSDAETRHVMQS